MSLVTYLFAFEGVKSFFIFRKTLCFLTSEFCKILPYRKRLPQEEDNDILLQRRQLKEPPAPASGSSSYKTQLAVEPSIVGWKRPLRSRTPSRPSSGSSPARPSAPYRGSPTSSPKGPGKYSAPPQDNPEYRLRTRRLHEGLPFLLTQFRFRIIREGIGKILFPCGLLPCVKNRCIIL